jgi:hypothetical protein
MLVYIVSWLLLLDSGDYGRIDSHFQKRFTDRGAAVEFVDNRPPEALLMTLDSISEAIDIDTTTERVRKPYQF